jgi:hypothetical protein
MRDSSNGLAIVLVLAASTLSWSAPAPALAQTPDSELREDAEERDASDRGLPDGDLPDGDIPDGDLPDGDLPDGDLPSGDDL